MKSDLFQSCGHCCVFQIYWHIECSILTASSFRIWNSSAAISSPALALFVVMLLRRAHLTSHSRMFDSRWLTTPSWLSGSLRSFLYSFSVYSYYLFLISSASVRSLLFLSFIVPIFAWNIPLISLIFLAISTLSLSVVFLYFFALFIEEGLLVSPCHSLELCIQLGIPFYFSFAFCLLLSSATCKASSDNYFAFLYFFFFGMVLFTASCKILQTCP